MANSRKVGSAQITPRNFWEVLSPPQPISPLQFNHASSKDLSQTTDWKDAGSCNMLAMEEHPQTSLPTQCRLLLRKGAGEDREERKKLDQALK